MKKSDGARRLIPAALLPGAALVLMTGVSSAAPIFHFANYTYLHEEGFSDIWNRLHSGRRPSMWCKNGFASRHLIG